VAGTVLGVQGNGQGVYGAAPRADLYYARVLGYRPSTGLVQGSSSDIMAGVRWLVEQRGCKVVNLSLGGGRWMKTEERFYRDMDNKGALIVAASGNDSAAAISYPSGYATVLSVGAVDVSNAHASFSNTGAGLDISAPGVLVLSSYPAGTGSEASVGAGASSYRAFGMEHAGKTSAAGISGAIVDCGLGTAGSCPASVAGNIALIQRGSISFADKVTNATAQGAAAAIVYNNAPGAFVGTLGNPGAWIPAVSVSDADGAALKAAAGSTATVVNMASSWEHSDGTSMATPHVSGIAALTFEAHAGWTDDDVEARLKATAQDLGAVGYDTTFGYGLVNAQGATAP
jgi:subtilisin family serine protease